MLDPFFRALADPVVAVPFNAILWSAIFWLGGRVSAATRMRMRHLSQANEAYRKIVDQLQHELSEALVADGQTPTKLYLTGLPLNNESIDNPRAPWNAPGDVPAVLVGTCSDGSWGLCLRAHGDEGSNWMWADVHGTYTFSRDEEGFVADLEISPERGTGGSTIADRVPGGRYLTFQTGLYSDYSAGDEDPDDMVVPVLGLGLAAQVPIKTHDIPLRPRRRMDIDE